MPAKPRMRFSLEEVQMEEIQMELADCFTQKKRKSEVMGLEPACFHQLRFFIKAFYLCPADDAFLREDRENHKLAWDNHKVLKKAAKILRAELFDKHDVTLRIDRPYSVLVADRARELEIAIRVLERPGIINVGPPLPLATGPAGTPWGYMARGIYHHTLSALSSLDRPPKGPGDATGSIITFIEKILRIILREKNVPDPQNIMEAVKGGRRKPPKVEL